MNELQIPDSVWHLAKLVVEEAYNRYGIELHARVDDINYQYVFRFVDVKRLYEHRLKMSYPLCDEDVHDLFLEFGFYPMLRRIAIQRDSDKRNGIPTRSLGLKIKKGDWQKLVDLI